jgi:hypothetical protein
VIDTKEGVSVSDLTPGAAIIALTLATERFGKSNLVVRGNEAFKSQMTRFAILQGMEIDFGKGGAESEKEHLDMHIG